MTSLPWYHKTTIYQIYPRSFYDSNGDGIGDIPGIIQKLDYIQSLGFETIWFSPFFSSPQADFGYDIAHYTDIAPEYGTLADVLQLIEEIHRRGMKVVFDMVMNHTSDQHPWFLASRSSRTNPKADWYLWRDKPNNWRSVLGGSGWQYAMERDQYFWATFLPFQPDLNYHHPEVKRTMFDIVRFWLEKGVDGFRLDIFNYIFKDAEFRDNPFSFRLFPTEEDSSAFFQQAKYTVNMPENFEFAREFRNVCDEFGDRLSVGEVSGGTSIIRKYLGGDTNDGLTLVFDFGMLTFQFTADYFRGLIQRMEEHYPHPFMPVYVFSNHDRPRSIKRLGGDLRKARLLHTLQLTVRGVPCMYYGEEIGMTDSRFPIPTALDPIAHRFKSTPRFVFDAMGMSINRDEVRTPMQWDEAHNAGFSSAEKTWLQVHDKYRETNVKQQSKDEDSLLNTIRDLLNIRNKEETLQAGSVQLIQNLPRHMLGYSRSLAGKTISVLLNFSDRPQEIPFDSADCIFKLAPGSQWTGTTAQLGSFGALILKHTS